MVEGKKKILINNISWQLKNFKYSKFGVHKYNLTATSSLIHLCIIYGFFLDNGKVINGFDRDYIA